MSDLFGSNCSQGVSGILRTMRSWHNNPVPTDASGTLWNLFLINAATIARNIWRTGISNEELSQACEQDTRQLLDCISAYASSISNFNSDKVVVCFYFPHYDRLSDTYKKDKFAISYVRYQEQLLLLKTSIINVISGVGLSCPKLDILICDAESPWAHQSVLSDINGKYKNLKIFNTLLISHIPLDFHLAYNFNSFAIFESFTGNLKHPAQIAKKVFLDSQIPFNAYTHILLGDNMILKSQLTRKQKSELMNAIKTEHWELLNTAEMLDLMLNRKYCTREILLTPAL